MNEHKQNVVNEMNAASRRIDEISKPKKDLPAGWLHVEATSNGWAIYSRSRPPFAGTPPDFVFNNVFDCARKIVNLLCPDKGEEELQAVQIRKLSECLLCAKGDNDRLSMELKDCQHALDLMTAGRDQDRIENGEAIQEYQARLRNVCAQSADVENALAQVKAHRLDIFRKALDLICITSSNIGEIRAKFLLPRSDEWNAIVRDEAAARENSARHDSELGHARQRITALEETLKDSQEKIAAMDNGFKAGVARLKQQRNEARAEIHTLRQQIASMRQKSFPVDLENERLKRELECAVKSAEAARDFQKSERAARVTAENELRNLKLHGICPDTIATLRKEIAVLHNKNQEQQADLNYQRALVKDRDEQRIKAEADRDHWQKTAQGIARDSVDLRAQLTNVRAELTASTARNNECIKQREHAIERWREDNQLADQRLKRIRTLEEEISGLGKLLQSAPPTMGRVTTASWATPGNGSPPWRALSKSGGYRTPGSPRRTARSKSGG